jgi:hypothetical protein
VLKSNRKELRNSAYPKLEESLKQWIIFVWHNKIPLTDPIIKEKAKDLVKISGIQNFEASDGSLTFGQEMIYYFKKFTESPHQSTRKLHLIL